MSLFFLLSPFLVLSSRFAFCCLPPRMTNLYLLPTQPRRLLSVLPIDTPKLVTSGSGLEDITLSSSPSRDAIEDGSGLPKTKRKKSVKGWDGEVMKPDLALRMAQVHEENGTSSSLSLTPQICTLKVSLHDHALIQ